MDNLVLFFYFFQDKVDSEDSGVILDISLLDNVVMYEKFLFKEIKSDLYGFVLKSILEGKIIFVGKKFLKK